MKTGIKEQRKKFWQKLFITIGFSFLLSLHICGPVNAAGMDGISSAFNIVYNIIAVIISSIGQILLLWGVFEWASALNSQDGTMQSMAFKRIAAGLVACLTPQLIPIIMGGVG